MVSNGDINGVSRSPDPCRHCGSPYTVVGRWRGLCSKCYKRLDVRGMYPARSNGRYVVKNGPSLWSNGVARVMPPVPTDAQPGSEEKILVLAERAANYQRLWHPDDATAAPSYADLAWGLEYALLKARVRESLDQPGISDNEWARRARRRWGKRKSWDEEDLEQAEWEDGDE